MGGTFATQVLGDEWADQVVKVRDHPRQFSTAFGLNITWFPNRTEEESSFERSTLLKSDLWKRESRRIQSTVAIRGAINFRNIPGTNIYALGRPFRFCRALSFWC